RRPAVLRAGLRGAGAAVVHLRPDGGRRGGGRVPRRARAALRVLLPGPARAAGGVGEPAGDRDRADQPAVRVRRDHGGAPRAQRHPAGLLRRDLRGDADLLAAVASGRIHCGGTGRDRGVRGDRAAAPRLQRHRGPPRQPDRATEPAVNPSVDPVLVDPANVDPVLVEIVKGSLASIEREVETAIGRTARSPMIRDAHDFRAGIHDRAMRKLTGRSYSALVQPVVRDYPLETMRPGDVFFHNDVYLSEGGIGHLPDLCVTVPVFHQGEVVAFVQAFGHHDDIGGAVPGSMPSHATSVFEEGLMVPPIRLWDQGRPNEAALKIMTRNSRMPDSLAADLDAECSACLMGARRLAELFDRYGRAAVESCFDAIIDATTSTFRREVLAKIPDGTYVWEDYAEHDGVDPPRLH